MCVCVDRLRQTGFGNKRRDVRGSHKYYNKKKLKKIGVPYGIHPVHAHTHISIIRIRVYNNNNNSVSIDSQKNVWRRANGRGTIEPAIYVPLPARHCIRLVLGPRPVVSIFPTCPFRRGFSVFPVDRKPR